MWNAQLGMVYLLFGYVAAAAGFYFLIAKTAKHEPELIVVSNPATRIATVIEIAEQYDKRAA